MNNLFRGPITGPKFFAIFASFFVVIISVNLVLAWQAVRTFPGLEVKNSYVASQTFDADRTAQLALGWDVSVDVHQGHMTLTINDAAGQPVTVQSLTATFGRATSTRDDQSPEFSFDGTAYHATVITAPGNWNLRLDAVAADGTRFRQRMIVPVDLDSGT